MITNPQKNRLANFLYGKQFDTEEELAEAMNMLSPENYYVGLSSENINEDGEIENELNGNGYSRIVVPNTSASFNETIDGVTSNKALVTWDVASAEWTVRAVFVTYDELTTEAAYVFNFDEAITVPNTATLYFDKEQLELSVSGV